MPYVPVPKDLTKVKTKLAFNLTKRQLICFSLAALVGLPVYFLTRGAIGNSAAVLMMIGIMMPFFFFAMHRLFRSFSPEFLAKMKADLNCLY